MANGHDPGKSPPNPKSGTGTGTGTGKGAGTGKSTSTSTGTGAGAGTGTGKGTGAGPTSGGITPMDDHKPPQARWWLPPRWALSSAV